VDTSPWYTSNDGNVGLALWNSSQETQFLKAGERVGQLVFSKYQTTEDLNNQERTGGFGSTN
jgi:dUTPase